MSFFKVSADQAEAFRIAPTDTNYFVILADQQAGDCASVAVIEIFTLGGKTPPQHPPRGGRTLLRPARGRPRLVWR